MKGDRLKTSVPLCGERGGIFMSLYTPGGNNTANLIIKYLHPTTSDMAGNGHTRAQFCFAQSCEYCHAFTLHIIVHDSVLESFHKTCAFQVVHFASYVSKPLSYK